jgi:DNA-binding Lrp family transcriptional regulator
MADYSKVPGNMTMNLERHQGSPALTACDLPETSRWAAESVNTTKMERVVLDTLDRLGPRTSEEIADASNFIITSITPRMAALQDRRIIKKFRLLNGEVMTRKGKSGCSRIIYELEPIRALWLNKRPTKPNRAEKIRQLEAEIITLNTIINNLKRGNLND